MNSISFDYLFNRVYDVLLWVKYTWLFTILRDDPEKYIADVQGRDWDGLRDRGWFDEYFAQLHATVPTADIQLSLWQRIFEPFLSKLPDRDKDGIPDVTDASINDQDNLSKIELKERYASDYSFSDHVKDVFGIGPKDTDADGVPDSYEIIHGLDLKSADSDRDGSLDGQEVVKGTNPIDSDSDGDLVLDGRDEAPLDKTISSIGNDTDGDGVSDRIEGFLTTDISKKDTDNDGISDNMDTYPYDPENVSQYSSLDFGASVESLHFAIQSPVLSFVADILSIVIFILLLVFVYVTVRWFVLFLEGLNHYDHHFVHEDGRSVSHATHIIKNKGAEESSFLSQGFDSKEQTEMPAGIIGLPLGTGIPVAPPSSQEFVDHPKFAVIQGYLSSKSEALWRIGILEADNVLLEVLNEKGYQGDGVGEKLKAASFKTIDLAWDAHKLRNRIAHEGSDFELTEREAKRAFMLYESVLRDLKAIR